MTIYDILGIAREALPLPTIPSNIQAGFSVSGTFPLNRHIFGDDEFLPAAVTDRSNPENSDNIEPVNPNQEGRPENEGQETANETVTIPKQDVTPEAKLRNSLIIINSPPKLSSTNQTLPVKTK